VERSLRPAPPQLALADGTGVEPGTEPVSTGKVASGGFVPSTSTSGPVGHSKSGTSGPATASGPTVRFDKHLQAKDRLRSFSMSV